MIKSKRNYMIISLGYNSSTWIEANTIPNPIKFDFDLLLIQNKFWKWKQTYKALFGEEKWNRTWNLKV